MEYGICLVIVSVCKMRMLNSPPGSSSYLHGTASKLKLPVTYPAPCPQHSHQAKSPSTISIPVPLSAVQRDARGGNTGIQADSVRPGHKQMHPGFTHTAEKVNPYPMVAVQVVALFWVFSSRTPGKPPLTLCCPVDSHKRNLLQWLGSSSVSCELAFVSSTRKLKLESESKACIFTQIETESRGICFPASFSELMGRRLGNRQTCQIFSAFLSETCVAPEESTCEGLMAVMWM